MSDKENSEKNGDSAELSTKWFRFRWGKNVRVSEIMSFILIGIVSAGFTMLYHHNKDVEARDTALIGAFGRLQSAQQDTTRAQQELNFIITLPQEQREKLNLQMPDSLRKRLRSNDDWSK